ncbi:MAG: hypothetical protein J0M34_02525 [Alphaproteobacteria bacterium]|nr:hypothetical protein [Alphaproteobacteria bacterium]
MSDDDKKDSGLLGLAGSGALAAGAGKLMYDRQRGKLVDAIGAGLIETDNLEFKKLGLDAKNFKTEGVLDLGKNKDKILKDASDALIKNAEGKPVLLTVESKALDAVTDVAQDAKAVEKAAKDAQKAARTDLAKNLKGGKFNFRGNMTMGQKGAVGVAIVATAVAGKMLLDATIGQKKEGHAERIESRREAEASAEPAR